MIMALLQSGMTIGEGDLYTTYEAECYNKIMSILNDPTNLLNDEMEGYTGYDRATILGIMSRFVYAPEYDVYYWPDLTDTSWDLMGGEYSDLIEVFEFIGEEEGVDCGLGVTTILNSHQGSAGF
jgi:hypothetical protein